MSKALPDTSVPLKEFGAEKVVAGQEFAVQVKKAAVKSKQAVVTRNLEGHKKSRRTL